MTDKFTDMMIDIETLALSNSNSLVLSFAAVKFNLRADGPVFGESITVVLDVAEQLLMGRKVDPLTQKWWSAPQQAEARVHWLKGEKRKLHDGLYELCQFYGVGNETRLWANGAVFDIGNLSSLYEICSMFMPWPHHAVRDARTLYRTSNVQQRARPQFEAPPGPQHEPHADCVEQIWRLWECWPEGDFQYEPMVSVEAAK
jgi:3' exoribonuclease, RNase T-like